MVRADVHLHTRACNAGCSGRRHTAAGDTYTPARAGGVLRHRFTSVRVRGVGGERSACGLRASSPGLGCAARVVSRSPPDPVLPLCRVNKQYRFPLAIACNLIAFVLVAPGRGREGGREGGREKLGPRGVWRERRRGLCSFQKIKPWLTGAFAAVVGQRDHD